ncbi:unnamed protein product [Didymodactylos carnosus]|uniref:Uncharacterized protein n=1 Tax=Didymodactylos carnosus TaxID=1234261 RepID=A0A816AH36_9BILA|nr:unnamed protein product [Didymodactylos carnosus]CAF4470090.1 unnamed protein product [Didymodactylos carnosus]
MDESEAIRIMKEKCLAAFLHNIRSKNRKQQHCYCLKTSDTWCSYQRDRLTNSNEDKNKEKLRLDPEFCKILHSLITKLTNESLLRRCLRGVTQNANESLNGIVTFVDIKTHDFRSIRGAAALASLYFNSGRTLLAEFFEETGININSLLLSNLLSKDEK